VQNARPISSAASSHFSAVVRGERQHRVRVDRRGQRNEGAHEQFLERRAPGAGAGGGGGANRVYSQSSKKASRPAQRLGIVQTHRILAVESGAQATANSELPAEGAETSDRGYTQPFS
jgi:hypothetical protein